MIKAIVFDAFDTVFQVEKGASAKYIIKQIANNGYSVNEAEFFNIWKDFYKENTSTYTDFKTEREIFTSRIQMFYDKYGINRRSVTDADFLMQSAKKRKAFDDVSTTLSLLKNKYQVYIGSNSDNDVLYEVMQRNRIKVDRIYTSENLRCYKPAKLFYEKIISDSGIQHNEIIFVGDNLIDDIWGPKQVNMKTCWLNRNGKQKTTVTPDYEINTLTELIEILDHI